MKKITFVVIVSLILLSILQLWSFLKSIDYTMEEHGGTWLPFLFNIVPLFAYVSLTIFFIILYKKQK